MTRRAIWRLLPLAAVLCIGAVAPTSGPTTRQSNMLADARWQYRTGDAEDWSDQPPTLDDEAATTFHARTAFDAPDPAALAVLELDVGGGPGQQASFAINGKPVPVPVEGMEYRTIPAIPADMLAAGRNVLEATIRYDGRKAGGAAPAPPGRLVGLTDRDLRIVTGPLLGAVGRDFFTVTCRTNMPADVSLCVAQIAGAADGGPQGKTSTPAESPSGVFHRLRAKPAETAPVHTGYFLVARRGEQVVQEAVSFKPLPAGGLRFAVVGDSRSNPGAWGRVTAAVVKAEPNLVLHSGDLVAYGRSDWQWDEQLFAPAKAMFASVPFYAVLGNHDASSPLYSRMFYGPGKDGDPVQWSQEINGVQLVGIDGYGDWSADSANARWLEAALAASKAKFVFLMSHYPAFSSGSHGLVDEAGRPKEKAARYGRDVIVPMLVRHRATAMFAGHDHLYERSELPGGLTHVISGGAGAGLYKKSADAARQNPYSTVFDSVMHYCIVDVDGEAATMVVRDLDGETIDTRTWKAREVSPAAP